MRRKLKTLGKRVVVLMLCLVMTLGETGGLGTVHATQTVAIDGNGMHLSRQADGTAKETESDNGIQSAADGEQGAAGDTGSAPGTGSGTTDPSGGADSNMTTPSDGSDTPQTPSNSGDSKTEVPDGGADDVTGPSDDADGETNSTDSVNGGNAEENNGDTDKKEEETVSDNDPLEEEPVDPEEDIKNSDIFDKFQDGSLDDLMDVDDDSVTAAMTWTDPDAKGMRRMKARGASKGWSAAAYYVGRRNGTDVVEEDDFSVKYQIEFHADTKIPEGGVKFRVPAYLLTERDGETKHYADDIAVPEAEEKRNPDGSVYYEGVPAKTISFNFYKETMDGEEYYVFFNYQDLPKGTNAAFQVLYRKMDIIYLEDGTEWSLPITVEVQTSDNTEIVKEDLATLTGRVDTKAEIESLTKEPYFSPATTNYTPALYTKRQIDEFINNIDYTGTNLKEAYNKTVNDKEKFDDYYYSVWAVRLTTKATQGYFVELKENLPEGAMIIGVSAVNQPNIRLRFQDSPDCDKECPDRFRVYAEAVGYEWKEQTKDNEDKGLIYQLMREADYRTIRIVVAYPKELFEKDGYFEQTASTGGFDAWNVTNDLTAYAIGVDRKDELTSLDYDGASFTYRAYKWTPPTTASFSSNKTNAEGGIYSTFNGWNNIYLESAKAGKDRGDFTFTTSAGMQDYKFTHDVEAKDVPAKEGPDGEEYYNRFTVADDLLYLSANQGGMGYHLNGDNKGDEGTDHVLLTKDDYYFSSVKIDLKDYGFDTTEDVKVDASKDPTYKWRSTKVYAMFANETAATAAYGAPDAKGWYLVSSKENDAEKSKNSEGYSSSYTFNEETLAMQPYRVKVEQESNAHTITATVKVAVRFRYDSPVLNDKREGSLGKRFQDLEEGVTLENNAGFIREEVTVDKDGKAEYTKPWNGSGDIRDKNRAHQDDSQVYVDGVHPERYRDFETSDPYGRNNTQGFAYLNPAIPRSKTFKYGTITNDPVHERVNQRYNLVVYNGYSIYDESVVSYMKAAAADLGDEHTVLPGHKEVVFYDLLPLGMTFDPSQQIVAGRIDSLDERLIQREPASWQTEDVVVTVDKDDDVIEDWHGTKRTLVRFHVKYDSDADPSAYRTYKDNRMWMAGWGLSFGCYYQWRDEDIAAGAENIFAFSTEQGDDRDLVGSKSGEYMVCPDDGTLPTIDAGSYLPFVKNAAGEIEGGNFRPDNKTVKSVLYGKGTSESEFSRSSEAKIWKRVRAEDDRFGEYLDSTEVGVGLPYSYEVTVTVTQGKVKNLVVYDSIEQAPEDLSGGDQEKIGSGALKFDENYWYGTFEGVNTNELETKVIDLKNPSKRIVPVVYYSADRDAAQEARRSGKSFEEIRGDNPDTWMKASDWERSGKSLADVKSVAVDMRYTNVKGADGKQEDFVLENMDAVSFKIKMRAPGKFQTVEKDEEGASRKDASTDATWAYNNSICSSTNADLVDGNYTEFTPQFSTSDATCLRLRDSEKLYIDKQFKDADAVPDAYKDTVFAIRVEQTLDTETVEEDKRNYTAYANQPYVLQEQDENGNWAAVDQVLRATDVRGCVQLKAGQRAELIVSDKAEYRVTEVENPFWEPEYLVDTVKQPVLDEYGNQEKDEFGELKETSEDHYTIINEYRPVVYFQKTVVGCPEEVKKDKDLMFHFNLEVKEKGETEFKPFLGGEYWIVDSAYGDNPTKLGSGAIGENGEFVVKPGEIIALFPGELGTEYRITEDLSGDYGKDWVIFAEGGDVAEGTLGLTVSRETFSNLYRWRTLEINKEITHQDAADCEQPFTFKVEKVTEDEDGNILSEEPVSDKTWELVEKDGSACTDEDGDPITGELDKDGTFTVACAGKTVRIKELEARVNYLVTEVTAEDGTSADEKGKGTEYRPLAAQQMVMMSVYSQVRELTFTNDYLLRPIAVSKTVAYAGQKTQAELNDLRDKTFTMTIYVEEKGKDGAEGKLEPYANKDFVRSSVTSGVTIDNTTDKDGRFEIRDGETVTFENVGREGLNFRIEETQDSEYEQIYPAPVDGTPVPAEGPIGKEGSKAVFINGTEGLLMLGKEYTADPADPAGSAYLNRIKEDSALRSERAVTMKLEVKNAEGEWVPYVPENLDETVTIIDTLGGADAPGTGDDAETDAGDSNGADTGNGTGAGTGSGAGEGDSTGTGNVSVTTTWGEFIGADGTFRIEPWKRVVVPIGTDKTEYRVSESWEDCSDLKLMADCGLEGFTSGYLATEAEDPEVTGDSVSSPVATIVNRISGIDPASTIGKAMLEGSDKVPTGAALVFQVQKFTGAAWEPAKGVRYVVTDYDPTVADDRQKETIASGFDGVATTGVDGKITVYKCDDSEYTANERSTGRYPKIGFETEVVKPEGKTEGVAGEYRLVELVSDSDNKWGNWYDAAWDGERNAGTIVNSNRPFKVKIAKQLEDDVVDDGTEFCFTLKQVTALKNGITTPSSKNDIVADKAAKGITYNVFDKDGNFIEQKTTNAAGQLKFKAGQYAELNVTDSTLWTVTENQDRLMKLSKMETEKNASTLAANLALINAKAGRVPAYIRAETDNYYVEYNAKGEIGNKFTVTLYWSDGTSEVLTFKEGEETDTTGKYTMTAEKNEDGTIRCRFESAQYTALFDTLTLRKRADGESKDFPYTGGVQTYTVPSDGIYQIELWGAQGGNDSTYQGGRGAYVVASVRMKKDQQLYFCVGGQGAGGASGRGGGYNGGGHAGTAGSSGGGGGATSVSLMAGAWNDIEVLENRILVAGGGGGAGCTDSQRKKEGGAAGGLEGLDGGRLNSGGKQNEGGEGNLPGNFGSGGNRIGDGGGGGGGWYGGGAGTSDHGGGGGSSFINGDYGCETRNPDFVFFDGRMIDGSSSMPAPTGDKEETGHTGSGYARIKRIK